MRNGTKSSFLAKLLPLFIIMIIIYSGFILVVTISSYKNKSEIAFNINKSLLINKNYYSSFDNVVATLYSEPNVYTSSQCADKFIEARAMVMGDSTAEGLVAYGALYDTNVIWTRGRSALYMSADLDRAIEYRPNMLFLAYGSNDLQMWNGDVDSFINSYRDAINSIRQVLPETQIFINSILPVSDEAKEYDPTFVYEPLFNEKLQEFCNSENITYINNNNLLTKSPDGIVYEPDGIHPKSFFYKLWANNMIYYSKM